MPKFTLDALRQSVAALFEKAEDQETIKKYALVENEINKAQEVLDQKDQKELELLKDLKEAYIHSTVKPEPGKTSETDIGAGDFNGDNFIQNFIETHDANGCKK